ncbi:hypothetical protein FGO68_gene7165 [Halteria grandinella]|uniref:Uncharacterized protein n=1 Tax=Halteria grandinella TaxID=5974 RepID=A0A8J8T590_HALGN|nr:hypothetical protein FGO68_gene7165 [Halteria grandinella]
MIDERNSQTISQIINSNDVLQLDEPMDPQVYQKLREDFLRGKIKRQMIKLMNHVEKSHNNKNLPSLILQNQDVLATYENIEKPIKEKSKDPAKLYSAEELRARQQEGQVWLRQMKKEEEERKRRQKEKELLEHQRFKQSFVEAQESKTELQEQMKEQRRRFLEIKAQERLQREQEREDRKSLILMEKRLSKASDINSSSSGMNMLVPYQEKKAFVQPEKYLYQKIEEQYLQTIQENEREEYQKTLEDRKKMLNKQVMSVEELKSHWKEYQRNIANKQTEIEQKRREERKKQKEAAELIQKRIKKTQFHTIVEQEKSPEREQQEQRKRREHLKEHMKAYAKNVSEVYKPKPSDQLIAEREQRIRNTDKEEFKRKKIEIQSSPYRDYFKESLKNAVHSNSSQKYQGKLPALASITNDASSVDSRKKTPLQSNLDQQSMKTLDLEPSENRRRGVRQSFQPKRKELIPSNAYNDNPIAQSTTALEGLSSIGVRERRNVDYMKQFRSKDDEDPQERKLREIKKEIDNAMAAGDMKAFDHAKYKLHQLELQTEREEQQMMGKGQDPKKNEELNRRMLKAIDAKLAILNNL